MQTIKVLAVCGMTTWCGIRAGADPQVAPNDAGVESPPSFVNITKGDKLIVSIGKDASPAEKRAAELFIDAVKKRTGNEATIGDPPSDGPAFVIGTAHSHALVKDYLGRRKDAGNLPIDGFAIYWDPEARRWCVAGQSAGGVVAGVGRMLRMIRFEQGRMSVPAVDVTDSPKMPIRGMYLWARPTYFTPQLADQVDRYIEEFALWGGNDLALWFEMGMFKSFDDKATHAWLALYRRHAETAQKMGMKFTLLLVANDGYQSSPKDLRIAPIVGCPASYLCPSKPEGARQLLAWQEQVLAVFKSLDGLIIFPADPGGCSCAECAPWATKGFWRAAKPLGDSFHARYPKAEIWLSVWHIQGQQFGGGSWQDIVTNLGRNRPAWLTGLQPGVAPYHSFARITAKDQTVLADSGFPLTVFPEISMYGNHKGLLVNKNYWEKLRAEMARYPAKPMQGGWPYSERWNTDIANVAFLCWFWDPQKKVDSVLEEYAAWYFGPCAPAVRQLLDLLDDGNKTPDRDAKAREAFTTLERDLPEWARNDWRWNEIAESCGRFAVKK